MKKICAAIVACVLLLAPAAAADKVYKLKDGIATVAKNLSDKLPQGSKVVILDIRSESASASEYIIEELTYELLELGKFVIVDRQSLDAIRSELTFQTSGDVSDESAQKLGAMLGAQTLISGSFEQLSNNYRFAVKAVKVQTSEIQYLASLTVASNDETKALFGKKAANAATPTIISSTPAATTAPGSFSEGVSNGELAAKSAGTGWYFMSGCCLSGVGIIIPVVVTPTVPTQYLMGKSYEYTQGFSEGYQKTAKGKNIRAAVLGCTTSVLILTVIYASAL